jgi:hypothetical protein
MSWRSTESSSSGVDANDGLRFAAYIAVDYFHRVRTHYLLIVTKIEQPNHNASPSEGGDR